MTETERRARMESLIRRYYDGCNEGNREKMLETLAPDAAHYFPAGSPFGTFRGAEAIAQGWVKCVAELGSRWTIDRLVIDTEMNEAVVEWTHWKVNDGAHLRGAEWYTFAPGGLIQEIRAHYAAPAHAGVKAHDLGGFDYRRRGYALEAPEVPGRPSPKKA